MATAVLTTMLTGIGSVQIINDGEDVAGYRVTSEDGPGPASAAAAVLAAHGWQIGGRWEQISGGITGGQWRASVEPTSDMED